MADGTRALVCASFRAANSALELHSALKPLVEAAILSELSRPGLAVAQEYAPPSRVFLYVFQPLSFSPTGALGPLGLAPSSLNAPASAHPLALVRREAQHVEQAPEEPLACFEAKVEVGGHPLRDKLHHELMRYGNNGPWGAAPGLWAKAAADALHGLGLRGVGPSREGVERLAAVCAHEIPGVVRWIDPLSFQALCDLIAVFAAERIPGGVEWGLCEADDDGLTPPPVLRVTKDQQSFHVPLGQHVLQWCVMPCRESEQIPSIGEWMEHEFP